MRDVCTQATQIWKAEKSSVDKAKQVKKSLEELRVDGDSGGVRRVRDLRQWSRDTSMEVGVSWVLSRFAASEASGDPADVRTVIIQ